jgi:membrane protein insertase Oxa1/YidC/SpoIIIJ
MPLACSDARARARHDCNPFKSFVPLLAQGPLFVCFFLAIKRMADLPSFEHGGAAWFTNLSGTDPLSGATFLATVEARAYMAAALGTCADSCAPLAGGLWTACKATKPPST